MTKETAYGLSLAGGIITLLISIFVVLMSLAMSSWMMMWPQFAGIARAAVALFGIWGIVVGIVILVGTNMMNEKNKERARQGSMLVLIFSILGLVTFQGLVVGPILSLIGGAIAVGATSK